MNRSHRPDIAMPIVKVFLVEDFAPIREKLAELLLTVTGVRIVGTADEPAAALDGIASSQPDVVIVDLQLKGGTSGLTVLRWLREHAPGTVALVLSNLVYPQIKEACLELGARLVLDKASEAFRLREVVVELTQSRSCVGCPTV